MKPDTNYVSHADVQDLILRDVVVDPRLEGKDPAAFDDLFKLSKVERAEITNLTVDGGGLQRENAIDCNRECKGIKILGAKLAAGKQNALTIKGGCSDILVFNVEITRPGGNCDIELGNHSDQSRKKTTGVVIDNVWRKDGKPVRLRVGHADWPRIVNSNVKIDYVMSYLLKTYLFFRYLF
jgi:hypothetical protein